MKILLVLLITSWTIAFSQVFTKLTDTNGESRNRSYDVLHYRIELSFDEVKKMVIGRTTTTFVPFHSNFTAVEFDAENMNFHSVTMGKRTLKFDSLATTLKIHLDKPYSAKDTITVTIDYDCIPKRGAYFVQPDSGYPDKPWQIWTQGEDMDNHHWFPCWDFPNDKATSEVIATVKDSYTFLSNGKLAGVKENRKNGTKTYHWKQTKPHVAYLVMFAAGEYEVLKETSDGIPLEYYVYKHHVADAKANYAHTAPMMKFFNQKIGFRYPWDKYAQVIVADFVAGGMENTSATTLMDRITVYNARARVDESATSLIAHEMSHQWWGDVVTCKDWRHIWLNESFASYFDPLYSEFAFGKDEFDNIMYSAQLAGINTDKSLGRKPIVSVGSYGANIYPRGASVLHMMRFVLGEELFWKSLTHYITKNQFRSVETNDLKLAIEEATGQNLYWFFDQWIYKAGYPKFDISSSYNDSTKTVALTVKQTQTQDSLTGLFITPVDFEITAGGASSTHRVTISRLESTYVFSVTGKPTAIQFDKGNWILKEVNYSSRSLAEWAYQAEHGSDVVARKIAAAELGKRDTAGTYISLLASIAGNDPFWSVRQSAVNALGGMKVLSDEKNRALIAALKDRKPQVRASAASALGTVRTPEAVSALQSALNDSSYSTEAQALTALSKIDSANALPYILSRLDVWSYGNQVANAALNALVRVDTAQALDAALRKVRYGAEVQGRNTAMNILKRIGRNSETVNICCVTLLSDKSGFMRSSAAELLGENGNAAHLSALQTLADKKGDSASNSAKKAIEKIKEREKK
jgi:aminopeptidase N